MLAGVDPVHLGIIFIFNLMIGLLTPPMGLALFLLADIAKAPMPAIFKALLPFYIPLFGALAIITVFPELTLWLPEDAAVADWILRVHTGFLPLAIVAQGRGGTATDAVAMVEHIGAIGDPSALARFCSTRTTVRPRCRASPEQTCV